MTWSGGRNTTQWLSWILCCVQLCRPRCTDVDEMMGLWQQQIRETGEKDEDNSNTHICLPQSWPVAFDSGMVSLAWQRQPKEAPSRDYKKHERGSGSNERGEVKRSSGYKLMELHTGGDEKERHQTGHICRPFPLMWQPYFWHRVYVTILYVEAWCDYTRMIGQHKWIVDIRIGRLWSHDDMDILHVKIDNLNDPLVGFHFIR